ncbi:Crp/Fnr family transcriptional regulator [Listeria costaricensis]|uniref:Crp/Fnr family transcriptional regulator n=1 Tax=Listeria costaricensis TaxID=2026604 RepID=UPI000C08D9D4|nr:Crp/Fnr family transcriptional regulator [Listeria costaricensis]
MRDLLNFLQLELFPDHFQRKAFKKNETIFQSASTDPAQAFGVVLDGVITVENQSAPKASAFYQLLKKDDFFGLEALLDNETHLQLSYKILAVTDCEIIFIDRDYLLDHLYVEPKFFHAILERISGEYMILMRRYATVNANPSFKLANALLEIIRIFELDTSSSTIVLPDFLSHQMLAHLTQSSRARITIALNDLRKQKIITQTRPIIIRDIEALRQISSKKC